MQSFDGLPGLYNYFYPDDVEKISCHAQSIDVEYPELSIVDIHVFFFDGARVTIRLNMRQLYADDTVRLRMKEDFYVG